MKTINKVLLGHLAVIIFGSGVEKNILTSDSRPCKEGGPEKVET